MTDDLKFLHQSEFQRKNILYEFQAEIDAACELIDFLRFNSFFGKELLKYQPISESPDTTLNLMRYRSLEGFVASGEQVVIFSHFTKLC